MSRSRVRHLVLFLAVALLPVLPAAADSVRSLQGHLQVYVEDDFERGTWAERYELVDPAGRRWPILSPAPELRRMRTGTALQLSGPIRDGVILSTPEWQVVDIQPLDGSVPTDAPAPRAAGDRTSVAILVDFADSSTACSEADVAETMWTGNQSIDGLYRETSFGTTGFPWDVNNDGASDTLRVQISATAADDCNSNDWANAADVAAQNAGHDLSAYGHRIYVLPPNTTCAWAGLGTLGCFGTCRTWVATCGLADVYAHELGHNLGLHHASTDDDNDGAVDCEYCDRSDFMGIGGVGWRHTNGPHKAQMGWLDGAAIEDLTGQPPATYTLEALQRDPQFATAPQVLTLGKPGTSDSYYLTFREREGYDSTLGTNYAAKTNVHRFSGSGRTRFLAALTDGQTFTDTEAGISFTQLSHGPGSASVQVGSTCAADTPVTSLSPGSQTGVPGEARDYTLSVTNQDDSSCGDVRFDFVADLPAGWSGSVAPSFLSLAPGASGNATFSVTPSPSAADGDYAVGVDVTGLVEDHDASADATITIAGVNPSAVEDLQGYARRRGYNAIFWTPSGEPAVAGYRVYRDGQLLGQVDRPMFMDRRGCAAACNYTVTAVDAQGRESSPSAVNVVSFQRSRKGPGR